MPATNPGQYRPLININIQLTITSHSKKTNGPEKREQTHRAKELIPEEIELIGKNESQDIITFKITQMVVKNNLPESLQIKNMTIKINNRWSKEQNLHNRRWN